MNILGKKRDTVKKIFKLRAKMKELKEQEALLSKMLKSELDLGDFKCGSLKVVFEEIERCNLDKSKLIKDIGEKKIGKYYTKSTIQKLSIKEAS